MAQTNPKTKLSEGPDAESRLRELDLDLEGLVSVVRQGEYARMEATDNDPQNAAGTDAYRYRVRGLRDVYRPTGKWDKGVDSGLELLVSVDGKRRVVTRGGDAGVGRRDAVPQPKQQVGESTVRAAHVNSQLSLFELFGVTDAGVDAPEIETWMLLVYRTGDTVRAELSLPSGIDKDDRALGWIERIILPDLDLSDSPAKSEGESGDGEPEPIHVPVTRKR